MTYSNDSLSETESINNQQNQTHPNFTPIAPWVTWSDSYGANPAYVELLGFPNSSNYQRIEALDFVIIDDVWDHPRYQYFARIEEANLNLPLMGLSR